MADTPAPQPPATPESIALDLLRMIGRFEGKLGQDGKGADKTWVLDTYAECLSTVRTGTHAKQA